MKIVNRQEFLKLPAGTVYAKGKPWAFESICFKHDSWDNDWIYTNACWVEAEDSGEAVFRLEESLQTGKSYPCERDAGRDGCFDEDAVFMVFEADDLRWLRGMIDTALRDEPPAAAEVNPPMEEYPLMAAYRKQVFAESPPKDMMLPRDDFENLWQEAERFFRSNQPTGNFEPLTREFYLFGVRIYEEAP